MELNAPIHVTADELRELARQVLEDPSKGSFRAEVEIAPGVTLDCAVNPFDVTSAVLGLPGTTGLYVGHRSLPSGYFVLTFSAELCRQERG